MKKKKKKKKKKIKKKKKKKTKQALCVWSIWVVNKSVNKPEDS